MRTRTRRWPLLLAGLLLVASCAEPGPRVIEVEGVLTLRGKPIENVLVEFYPESEAGVGARRSSGRTDEHGVFRLRYDDPKDGLRQGVAVGQHRVLLTDLNPMGTVALGRKGRGDGPRPGAKPARFGKEYGDLAQPKFRREIGPGTTKVTIEMTEVSSP